ncbi:alpha-E domain-containing protein [Pelagovum pacificum]|uniref:Alpha-E domain-containing protein n=1 Tax=Pelagovum pacificum TaxID=2588711 RepID=A0A5C5G7Y6_9RHOB|nr:alpha-E domain-containing protein [Pelagovum pacificum]QQA41898.1 alpha-E domain-containing protein [Pelagovum pacificum]TNY30661.1 alpha-E domain-containing protein [Pelagovum pacificum]
MLGKTANGLFWMYRNLERAENTSRLVETGERIALTRSGDHDDEWGSILQTTATKGAYLQQRDEVTKDYVVDWLLRSPDNPSSVMSCISAARQNARMTRTALTGETWEAMNGCYMALKEALARKVTERDLPAVLKLIRQRTALVRGATHGTMLRNDVYDFVRIGTFLERADNTARILDVKYYVLLPSSFAVGSSLDNVQWETILRSVSARGGYRMVHGDTVTPRDIAQFLILDKRMPRSLNFCCSKMRDNLNYLVSDYGFRPECWGQIDMLVRRFLTHKVDAIFDYGLHEYIQTVLTSLSEFSRQIEIDYRFYE